jgi:ethanolamine permease
MVSFLVLRMRFPEMDRPYVSPAGMAGAAVAAAIAIATLVMLFVNRDYNKGVIGAAVWFLLGIGYFVGHARRRLILAPEEEMALGLRRESSI